MNELFDPFKPKKVLKQYSKKKKNFDLFKKDFIEVTNADKLDKMKDNLKETVVLKLKQ